MCGNSHAITRYAATSIESCFMYKTNALNTEKTKQFVCWLAMKGNVLCVCGLRRVYASLSTMTFSYILKVEKSCCSLHATNRKNTQRATNLYNIITCKRVRALLVSPLLSLCRMRILL